MFKLIIEIIVVYFLYKLVVDLVIPVYRTTKMMKEKMEETARRNMETAAPRETEKPGDQEGEYIDYEEIK